LAALCTVTYVLVERPCRHWGRKQVEELDSLSPFGSVG
jgi:hypothetical protein